jgi:hypothetical protein
MPRSDRRSLRRCNAMEGLHSNWTMYGNHGEMGYYRVFLIISILSSCTLPLVQGILVVWLCVVVGYSRVDTIINVTEASNDLLSEIR